MLALKPNCEHCDKDLAADSLEAMICSYECTFCRGCVDHVLGNVCPNCGGGFTRRPVRTRTEWRPGLSLKHQPMSEKRFHKPVNPAEHVNFALKVAAIPPEKR